MNKEINAQDQHPEPNWRAIRVSFTYNHIYLVGVGYSLDEVTGMDLQTERVHKNVWPFRCIFENGILMDIKYTPPERSVEDIPMKQIEFLLGMVGSNLQSVVDFFSQEYQEYQKTKSDEY